MLDGSIFCVGFVLISLGERARAMIKAVKESANIDKKMALHPKECVIRPPATGPQDRPAYPAATEIPRTLPRFSAGNTLMSIATFVAKIIAEPTPCKERNNKNTGIFGEKMFNKLATQNSSIPNFRMDFFPYISAALPIGIANNTATIRKEIMIQESKIAVAEKSLPIWGTAIVTDETAKVLEKFVINATTSVAF